MQISWIPSVVVATLLLLLILFQSKATETAASSQNPGFDVILMYCSGALLEVIGEPWFNAFQSAGHHGPRLKADTAAVFVRSAVTFVSVVIFSKGIRGFGYAQVAYGLTHLLTLVSSTSSFRVNGIPSTISDFLPRTIDGGDTTNEEKFSISVYRHIDYNTAAFAWGATLSSILKHLLTEADKIALSLTSSSYDQGIFAIANNYGSLVARMIFLPIEESSRVAFSRMAAERIVLQRTSESVNDSSSSSLSTVDARRNQNLNTVPKKIITTPPGNAQRNLSSIEMEKLLVLLLQMVSTMGLMFIVFGPPYARVVVTLLFPRKYRGEESVRTLSAVCVNVFVLALNGVLEAFVHAAAPSSTFKKVNTGFIVSSVLYIVSAAPLSSVLGTGGLVLAGSISMLARIGTSYYVICDVFSEYHKVDKSEAVNGVTEKTAGSLFRAQCSPPALLFIATLVVWGISMASSQRFYNSNRESRDMVEHIAIGGLALIILLCAILRALSKERLNSILKYARLIKEKAA